MADSVQSSVCDPFLVPEGQFCDHVQNIVVLPPALSIPHVLAHEDAVKERFETAISDTLTAWGYTVMPSGTVRQALSGIPALRDRVHGPSPEGAPGPGTTSLKQECLRELRTALCVDAILYPEIVVVQAECTGGTARWYGTAQTVYTPCKALLELMSGPACSKVPALSLLIRIHDMADRQVYSSAAGIEILQRMGVGRLIDVPSRKLLINGARNRRAVQSALAGLNRTGSRAGSRLRGAQEPFPGTRRPISAARAAPCLRPMREGSHREDQEQGQE